MCMHVHVSVMDFMVTFAATSPKIHIILTTLLPTGQAGLVFTFQRVDFMKDVIAYG